MTTQRPHVTTIGWGAELVTGLMERVGERAGFETSHIVFERDYTVLSAEGMSSKLHRLHPDVRAKLAPADPELLRSIEHPEVPTVHNMISGDRVVRYLPYEDALAYASYLARRLETLLAEIRPTIVIGAFDSIHGAIGLGVSKKLGLPWFAMNFTPLPRGFSGFCTGMAPRTTVALGVQTREQRRGLAEKTLSEFEERQRAVPAYISANSMGMVLRRVPQHAAALVSAVGRVARRQGDRYTEYGTRRLVREYVRKRTNLVRLPRGRMIERPPEQPFAFFGLHMQPESSVDVWAPFYADQFRVVEAVARALPPTHAMLVKLHKSDADNYSPDQLARLASIPAVQVVSPFAQSRPFVDAAAMIVAIQGTMALEAGLLGKPVLMFGDSNILDLPSVTRAGALHQLPELIRKKLEEPRPSRADIVAGFDKYLSGYEPGCYNDWTVMPTEQEIDNLARQFDALMDYVRSTR